MFYKKVNEKKEYNIKRDSSLSFAEKSNVFSLFFSLRTGGVSKEPFASLNLGMATADEEENVKENYRRFQQRCGYPPPLITATQVHGTTVLSFERDGNNPANLIVRKKGEQVAVFPPDTSDTVLSLPLEADGLYTEETALSLGVFSADCLPVFAGDEAGSYILLLHAGWRGLTSGILEEGFQLVRKRGKKMEKVWLAPAIGGCCFEMGEENLHCFHPEALVRKNGQWYADLKKEAVIRFSALGVAQKNIQISPECTFCDPSRFFSYRRDGKTGRHLTLAWRKQKTG